MPIQQGGRDDRRLLFDGENTKPVQRMRSDTMSAWDASVLDDLMYTRVSSRGSVTDYDFIQSEMKIEERKMTPKPPTDRAQLIPTPTEGEIKRYQKFFLKFKLYIYTIEFLLCLHVQTNCYNMCNADTSGRQF